MLHRWPRGTESYPWKFLVPALAPGPSDFKNISDLDSTVTLLCTLQLMECVRYCAVPWTSFLPLNVPFSQDPSHCCLSRSSESLFTVAFTPSRLPALWRHHFQNLPLSFMFSCTCPTLSLSVFTDFTVANVVCFYFVSSILTCLFCAILRNRNT